MGVHSHDIVVVSANEVEDLLASIAWLDVGFDAAQSVEHRSATLIDVAVSLGDIVDDVLGEAFATEHKGIHPEIYHRVVSHDGEWRHVARDAAATLDERPFADATIVVQDCVAREDGVFAHMAVAGNLHAVAKHATTLDYRVMPDMSLCHNKRAFADASSALGCDSAVDNHSLANLAVVSDIAESVLAVPAEILWLGADDSTLIHFDILTHAGAAKDARVGHYLTIVPYFDILVDIGKRMNCYVVAQFGLGIDIS